MAAPTFRSRLEARLRESGAARRAVDVVERAAANVMSRVVPSHMMKNKRLFDVWERRGYHVVPAHFYEPLPDTGDLEKALAARSSLAGLDLAAERARALLVELQEWKAEYDALPLASDASPDGFYLENTLFGSVDAEMLYALIRRFRPERVFEIGSGFSTLVAARALRANEAETGTSAELVAFEPYPTEVLRRGVATSTRLDERRLQDVPLDTFDELGAGDILFIDSSHVVATGSDVCIELLDIVK